MGNLGNIQEKRKISFSGNFTKFHKNLLFLGNFEDLEHEKHYLDECNASKVITHTRNRQTRKNFS
jgi:hypothetical protein